MTGLFFAVTTLVTNATVTLPSVIVEASRLDRTASEIPGAVQTITRREIVRSGARSAAELLARSASSVELVSPGGSNPALAQLLPRGYGENGFGRLLVVVDGERLNNPDLTAPDLSRLDLGSVERIEILQGSQNVLHGDAASAGVINVVTDPGDYDPHGRVELHGGSWDSFGAHASFRGGNAAEDVRYWAHGGWERSDGYRDDSDWSVYDAGGGFRRGFDGGSFLRMSAFFTDSDSGMPGFLTKEGWRRHPEDSDGYADRSRRTTEGVNATAYGVIDDDNAVRLTQTLSHRRLQSRGYGMWYTDYDIWSYAFTPEWINTSQVRGLDHELLAGSTFRYDRNLAANWPSGGRRTARTKNEYERTSFGAYAQDTLRPTDALAFEAGVRAERAWNECTMASKPRRVNDLFAADASVLFTPTEGLKTYLRLSCGYRLPFIDEVAFHSRDRLLSPERDLRADLGFDWTPAEEVTVAANVFVSRTKSELFYNPLYAYAVSGYEAFGDNVNSPSPVLRGGADLRVAWEREKTAGVAFACSLVRAVFDGGRFDGNDVPLVAAVTASARARVWLWDDCFVFFGCRAKSACRSISDFDNAYPRTPGFALCHAGVRWEPSFAPLDGFFASFTVENLFDRNACDYSSYGACYWPCDGRSFAIAVGYEF